MDTSARTVVWYQHPSNYGRDELLSFACVLLGGDADTGFRAWYQHPKYIGRDNLLEDTSARFLWPGTSILAVTDVTNSSVCRYSWRTHRHGFSGLVSES